MKIRVAALGLLFLLMLAGTASAQLIASRDLTEIEWLGPEPLRLLKPECPRRVWLDEDVNWLCGDVSRPRPTHSGLVAELVDTPKGPASLGDRILVTVRLTNRSGSPISIPWASDGRSIVHVTDIPDGIEEVYQFSELRLQVTIGAKSFNLEGWTRLYGDARSPGSLQELPPGGWAELHMAATMILKDSCGATQKFRFSRDATLTASYTQGEEGETLVGCKTHYSHESRRTAVSVPVAIMISR